jgi:hypothetical protein
MKTGQSKRKTVVRRITVDERLADDLFRLAVCSLADGVTVFFDRQGDWGAEREVWARPKNYAQKLGVPLADAPSWESLEEGQLFLSGEFEIVGDRTAPEYMRVKPGEQELLRMDTMTEFKEGVKQLYSVLLTGGRQNG